MDKTGQTFPALGLSPSSQPLDSLCRAVLDNRAAANQESSTSKFEPTRHPSTKHYCQQEPSPSVIMQRQLCLIPTSEKEKDTN